MPCFHGLSCYDSVVADDIRMNYQEESMLGDFELTPEASTVHISIFAERYNKLLGIARSLTNNDQGQAVDIVHDALISFVRYSPDLRKINNLDGYLRALLCNLFKAHMQRVTARSKCELPIENHDLIEGVLPGIADRCCDPNFLLDARCIAHHLRVCLFPQGKAEARKCSYIALLPWLSHKRDCADYGGDIERG